MHGVIMAPAIVVIWCRASLAGLKPRSFNRRIRELENGVNWASTIAAAARHLCIRFFSRLEQAGLSPTDLHSIECLDDRAVLNQLPGGFRWLKKNLREDVILYFETYASLLEDQLISSLDIAFLLSTKDQRELSAV